MEEARMLIPRRKAPDLAITKNDRARGEYVDAV
jgi:hypothetical protein